MERRRSGGVAPASEGAAFDRLRNVFDNLPAAVMFVRGPEHVFEFVNRAYRRLVGDRAFEGLTIDQAMPELREQGFVELLDRVYSTGDRFVGPESKVTLVHDGVVEEIVVDFIYEPLRGATGDVEGVLGFAVDVTAAVRARDDRFRAAIDSMNDTVIIASPLEELAGVEDLVVSFVNSGSDELGRRRRDELMGRRFRELWPNVESSGLLGRYLRVLESGQPLALADYDYRDVVGGTDVGAIFDITATRLGEDLFLVFRDVTERARRDRALAESSARLAREHDTVLALQAALLPRVLPRVDGLEIAAEYVAATEGVEVGGDWFDVFLLPDGHVAVCVGDVAGKGIEAAQVMAQLRSAGRVAALAGQGPAEVMASKNNLMIMGELGPFATTTFTRYDPRTGEIVWISAGHLPPLLVRADGRPPELLPTPEDPPIGVVPGAEFTRQKLVLELGDRLVLYTDGLVERRGESIVDGMERLRQLVPADADAATTCRTLLEALRSGADRPDDICVVTLRRTA